MKIFNTEVFQGNLNKKRYFEGWYFKHVSHDKSEVYAFIPGISLNENDSHAFIQVINGISGKTNYITYKLDDFNWSKKNLYLEVGSSVFTDRYIDLKIDNEEIAVKGILKYTGNIKYPKSLLSPSIMGWYSYIPFMECNHGIVSVNHTIAGNLSIHGKTIDFSNGSGYIEKDWGTSFPESWIWLHSNSFSANNTSLFLSIAKIPWMGSFFIGFISFLYHNGEYYKFSTYNNSKISSLILKNERLTLMLESKKYVLMISCTIKGSGELKAPTFGKMTRRIKESIDSEVHVQLYDNKQNLLFDDLGTRSGLEIIEKIFEYFK